MPGYTSRPRHRRPSRPMKTTEVRAEEAVDQLEPEDTLIPTNSKVAVVMGSASDMPVMRAATELLKRFNIPFHLEVISAHRTPKRVQEFAERAYSSGFYAIIAGAGGAAHLPGMLAANTIVPVIGVPIPTKHLNGVDSLYSIVQMPDGVPVATVSIGGAENAAILALQILATADPELADKLHTLKGQLADRVEIMNSKIIASDGVEAPSNTTSGA